MWFNTTFPMDAIKDWFESEDKKLVQVRDTWRLATKDGELDYNPKLILNRLYDYCFEFKCEAVYGNLNAALLNELMKETLEYHKRQETLIAVVEKADKAEKDARATGDTKEINKATKELEVAKAALQKFARTSLPVFMAFNVFDPHQKDKTKKLTFRGFHQVGTILPR